MASDDPGHRRSYTTPQSIPLQDLNRPIEEEEYGEESSYHRRTLSERGRRLFTRDGTRAYPSTRSSRYAPLQDNSTSYEPYRIREVPVEDDLRDETSLGATTASSYHPHNFAGLSFGPEPSYTPVATSTFPQHPYAFENLLGSNYSTTSLGEVGYEEVQLDASAQDDDSAPLTDSRYVQPMGKSSGTTQPGSDLRYSGTKSVRFSMVNPLPAGSRLGDDLPTVEAGQRSQSMDLHRSGSIAHSLSIPAENPFQRAGTIVKKMSQRVVNLSNEPEMAEKSIRRRQSQKKSGGDEGIRRSGSTEYANDGTADSAPSEKSSSLIDETPIMHHPLMQRNPLRGKSLGLLGPENKIRRAFCELLVHPATEPLILCLIVIQTILLAINSGSNVRDDIRPAGWGSSNINYAIVGLFIVYTIESVVRIIVSGFIINPIEYSTINRSIGLREALKAKSKSLFALQNSGQSQLQTTGTTNGSLLHSLGYDVTSGEVPVDSRQAQRRRLAHRAYLRHSFNRLDFLAVISFWISFGMNLSGFQESAHVYLFQMLSSLRILRLLNLTNGTLIILRSLKKAAPLLLNVALLIGFFWLLFAIIGVQSFKSSLRRTCVWTQPNNASNNYTLNFPGSYQFCGGSFAANGSMLPWVYPDGSSSGIRKGYLCPVNSVCMSTENPYNGTVNFDNIFNSMEQFFIIMTSNTYSDIMYYVTDSDYLVAALFFAAGIVVGNFWLVSLLIAVITSSFQIIREETKNSAFANKSPDHPITEETSQQRRSRLSRFYDKTFPLWILIIAYGLICQCLRSSHMSSQRESFIDLSESAVTLILLFEIAFRFTVDWRNFFTKKTNWVDLGLAIITTIMQIPVIHNSGQAYEWLTFFQIIRIYRVVLAIPWTRDLILLVLGSFSGITNLILFVFLLTFLAAIFASQLFRGDIPETDINGNIIHVTFSTIWNSFLGMYQILSIENWTTILYDITGFDTQLNTAWYGAMFIILWVILSSFIVLNMFIAVIQENFDVSEDEKRVQQVKVFLRRKEIGQSSNGTLALSSLFKLGRFGTKRQDPLDYGPALMEQLLKEAVVEEFLDDNAEPTVKPSVPASNSVRPLSTSFSPGILSWVPTKLQMMFDRGEVNPFYSRVRFSRIEEELDPKRMVKEAFTANEERKRAQREYLARHPNYNVSLFLFKPGNPIRRLCQKIVGPGRGSERVEGQAPSAPVWYTFSAVLYAAIVAMVLLACVTTPLYQKQYFNNNAGAVNWYTLTDLAFAIVFTVEAAIRIIADGFFWTPNAYLRSSWGFIDGIVLITLWINVAASFYNEGAVTRAVGAFKALRALRLLNVSNTARDTFHAVIIQGGWKVLSAAFVSLSLLIPFAIYGLNLFNGRMELCNDNQDGIFYLADCVNEWQSTPYSNNWPIIAPRVVANPYYNFDNFGNSLFILFQIVSQEGWVDVMWSAQSVTGFFTQPIAFASQGNAVFFVVFNLLGSVFVLTLFVSVFMRNYTEQTGVAYLTTDQRSWLELRKLLRQVSPSKRPPANQKRNIFSEWCYKLCIRKTGRWQRFYTGVLVFHLVLLCIEFYPESETWYIVRNFIFLALTLFYVANIIIRIVGLTWSRFRKSSWDLYSLLSVGGTFVTTILYFPYYQSAESSTNSFYQQMYKLFLVSILLLLIPRNNQLDQLFKTAAASFTNIANLLATWFVLFLVYAIAFTQTLGLTRFNSNENGNINFRDVPKALILLFRMSTGEGWNQLMQDFAMVVPPYCTQSDNFLLSDCGSPGWARVLFITWNILSMYIFVNMFISLIFESFSYVYQRSSGLGSISRNEIRRFKEAWSYFDPDGTGYISKEKFPRLLGELSGVFDMRVYSSEFNVGSIISECKVVRRESELPIEGQDKAKEIDLQKLNKKLSKLPIEEIRQRRRRLNIFYEEVLNSADDRGIGFTDLLMILAHYKVINDNKSLRLEEFLRRRARLQRVEDDVRRGIVSDFLDTVYWSTRFRKIMQKKHAGRMNTIPQFQVPEIYVDDESPVSPIERGESSGPARPALSLQIPLIEEPIDSRTSASSDHRSQSESSDWLVRRSSIQMTPVGAFTSGLSPHGRSGSDISDAHIFSGSNRDSDPFDTGEREDRWMRRPSAHDHRSRSNSNVSAREVRDVFDNSAWGESLRRSFTSKRRSKDD